MVSMNCVIDSHKVHDFFFNCLQHVFFSSIVSFIRTFQELANSEFETLFQDMVSKMKKQTQTERKRDREIFE